MDGFWFKSTRFAIEPGEDEETNPRIYGRQLAAWLKAQLEQRGYQVEPVIVEDWGHCLMCSRVPFLLWVGCGNVSDLGDRQRSPPDSEDVVWHCFSKAEIPFWRRIFQNMDTSAQLARLNADLDAIFLSEPQIVLVAEP